MVLIDHGDHGRPHGQGDYGGRPNGPGYGDGYDRPYGSQGGRW